MIGSVRPRRLHTAMLLAAATGSALAAPGPQDTQLGLSGLVGSSARENFLPRCVCTVLSVPWLACAARKPLAALRRHAPLMGLAGVALGFVDVCAGVVCLSLSLYASVHPRHVHQPTASVPRA